MSSFAQTSNNFYSTISYNRPSTTSKVIRNRMASTATESFGQANRPSTGFMIRSHSSSFKNSAGKLDTLKDSLTDIYQRTKQMQVDTKDLKLRLVFLKQELTVRGIEPIKNDLAQQIKVLQKNINISKRSDYLRFEALAQTCQALTRNTKQIKNNLNHLNDRLHQIENLLGYHGLREKLKY